MDFQKALHCMTHSIPSALGPILEGRGWVITDKISSEKTLDENNVVKQDCTVIMKWRDFILFTFCC